MSDTVRLVVSITIGYFLGSIPAGYIAGRIAGIDIRKQGSGNIGATNVTRTLGKRYGYPVFGFDLLKGVMAVVVAGSLAAGSSESTSPQALAILAGVACVVGHSFPVWLGFRGGKGVATSIGVVLGLMPGAAVIVLIIWGLTFQLGRYVSVASLAAAIALPIVVAVTYARQPGGVTLLYFSFALMALIILRHRANISRLIRGSEPRFRRR
jgi:glycerol-3-phosphate acyltransferase PlsY